MVYINNGLKSFIKKVIRAQIIKDRHNHMTPGTSNCVGTNQEAATVEKKGFQIPPLPYSSCIGVIYTI